MEETDAVKLENWFPETADVRVRDGFSDHVTGIGAQVESIMTYNRPNGTQTMFAAGNSEIYNVTSAGAVGAAVQTGLSNDRWQHVNYTNSAGTSYLCCFNGADAPRYWDNSSWTTVTGASSPAITGVTTTGLISAFTHKRRMWLIEKDSLKLWYLPVDSVGGAAKALDVAGNAQRGGYIMAGETWTLDSGEGIDDLLVVVTSEGEAIVYSGTDPSSASTWSLKGVWRIGEPIGRRCIVKYKGDCLIICRDGLYALSTALIGSTAAEDQALTYKINKAMRDAAFNNFSNFGWQIFHYPKGNQLILNMPESEGSLQEQFVMNTFTGAWGRFTGIEANCWGIYNGDAYFGTNGEVVKYAAGVYGDNGANIDTDLQQAFSYLKSRGRLKHIKAMRPNLLIEGGVGASIGVDWDFETGTSLAAASFSPFAAGVWDTDLWDTGTWGGVELSNPWLTAEGTGTSAALRFKTATQANTRLAATDYLFEYGGVIG
jgi:hypothetical protein